MAGPWSSRSPFKAYWQAIKRAYKWCAMGHARPRKQPARPDFCILYAALVAVTAVSPYANGLYRHITLPKSVMGIYAMGEPALGLQTVDPGQSIAKTEQPPSSAGVPPEVSAMWILLWNAFHQVKIAVGARQNYRERYPAAQCRVSRRTRPPFWRSIPPSNPGDPMAIFLWIAILFLLLRFGTF